MIAYCWRNGRIEFGRTMPEGAIEVARGGAKPLRDIVDVLARHGYERGVLLVPGVPEAEDDNAAVDALARWQLWCARRSYPGVRWNVSVDHVGVELEVAHAR
jgi:hypothetical protein